MSRKRRRSGYITVEVEKDIDICDILDEIEDDDLIEEVKERGLKIGKESVFSPDVNYRSICDVFGMGYHTPITEIMKMLEIKLNNEKIN